MRIGDHYSDLVRRLYQQRKSNKALHLEFMIALDQQAKDQQSSFITVRWIVVC